MKRLRQGKAAPFPANLAIGSLAKRRQARARYDASDLQVHSIHHPADLRARYRVADPVLVVHLRATKKQVKVEVKAEKNLST